MEIITQIKVNERTFPCNENYTLGNLDVVINIKFYLPKILVAENNIINILFTSM